MFSNPGPPPWRGRPLRAARPRAERAAALEGGVAELVVPGLLLGVGEDVVGVLDFLELRLGRLVAGVGVGVVLPGEPPIRLLDLVGRGVPGDAQDLVIISVGHRIPQVAEIARTGLVPLRPPTIGRPFDLSRPGPDVQGSRRGF